ncbi:MAG: hypothetical protein Q7S55_03740 [Nanoarchaeota archaeon]|nr:hypothetical protein [Nanoarchaeota archaeon]
MATGYHPLNELVDMIEEPSASLCRKVLADNYDLFSKAIGSTHNHQAWEGGYLDHLTEIMNIAVLLYKPLNEARPLPFSLSDSLLALYLHDLEKPWRIRKNEKGEFESIPQLADKEKSVLSFVEKKLEEYGFVLTEEQWNSIKYAEGEKSSYSSDRRIQLPLAAFVHMCDTWSARGWFNYPAEENDPWKGAERQLSW